MNLTPHEHGRNFLTVAWQWASDNIIKLNNSRFTSGVLFQEWAFEMLPSTLLTSVWKLFTSEEWLKQWLKRHI